MDNNEQVMIEDLSVYRGQINMSLNGEPVKRSEITYKGEVEP